MTATLAYRPPADAPDSWDLLDGADPYTRREASDRQRTWTAAKGGPGSLPSSQTSTWTR